MPTPGDYEIERKYLLRGLPDRVAGAPVLEIEQGYIPGERITERVRRARADHGTRYYRTIKAGSGLVKLEVEEEITDELFIALWPLTRGARVAKRRYLIREADVVWEIDEFVDRADLWFAEVELQDAGQIVSIPAWLEPYVVREVTEDRAFTNRALAK
jgi:CYTH domain-containing protein